MPTGCTNPDGSHQADEIWGFTRGLTRMPAAGLAVECASLALAWQLGGENECPQHKRKENPRGQNVGPDAKPDFEPKDGIQSN